jgi:hypothetical protein
MSAERTSVFRFRPIGDICCGTKQTFTLCAGQRRRSDCESTVPTQHRAGDRSGRRAASRRLSPPRLAAPCRALPRSEGLTPLFPGHQRAARLNAGPRTASAPGACRRTGHGSTRGARPADPSRRLRRGAAPKHRRRPGSIHFKPRGKEMHPTAGDRKPAPAVRSKRCCHEVCDLPLAFMPSVLMCRTHRGRRAASAAHGESETSPCPAATTSESLSPRDSAL